MLNKATAKRILGRIPLTAEVYWRFIQKEKPLNKRFSLHQLEAQMPVWSEQAEASKDLYKDSPRLEDQLFTWKEQAEASKHLYEKSTTRNILVFGTLRYWIGHTSLLSFTLAGMRHNVTYVYLPYSNWQKRMNQFDLRRQNSYAKKVFRAASPTITPVSLIDLFSNRRGNQNNNKLPSELKKSIEKISLFDTQYTLQIEEVNQEDQSTESGKLYQMRLERNTQAAKAILNWFTHMDAKNLPDVIITPNGSILEMGAIYQVAKHLQIPVVTYEFGEQRERIWFAQNDEVMRQETDKLWSAQKDYPFTESQWQRIQELYASRQNAQLWNNFSRLWQETPSMGGEKIRNTLGLDDRPVVLLAANVIGDSLTLGRQVFSENMTAWLRKTIRDFLSRDTVQLIVRVHPGERYTQGPSVANIIRDEISGNPEHIHLIEADSPVNTYDLIEIADLGLVYTTTVGMEMAMSGVPVIVAGHTHYRNKGFTIDPDSWHAYFNAINTVLANPQSHRLSKNQMEDAWHYAYLFFFEYPQPFPWCLANYWDKLETWTIQRVLSNEGKKLYGKTFDYLIGEPRDWSNQVGAA